MTAEPGPEQRRGRELTRRQLFLLAGGATLLTTAGVTGLVAGRRSGSATGERRLAHPFWSRPLPRDAPLATTSEDYVARLASQASLGPDTSPVSLPYGYPFNIGISTTDYSVCIYRMPDDWPRRKVWSAREKTGLQEVLDAGVPVPDPDDLPDGSIAPEGTDGAVIILQGDELWELWQFSPGGPSGYDWSCEQGGHMAHYPSHPGWWAGSPAFGGGRGPRVEGYDWGVSASGLSYLGGILTAEDFYADAIEHPLPLALPITGEGDSTPSHLLPATRYDQVNFTEASDEVADAYRLPEGARFRLPHEFDIEAWVGEQALPAASDEGSTADVLRRILVCLRDHGLIVAESAGIVGFSGEHEKVFGTRYHPYAPDDRPEWGNFGHQVPWTALVQLAPPDTDISVPRSG